MQVLLNVYQPDTSQNVGWAASWETFLGHASSQKSIVSRWIQWSPFLFFSQFWFNSGIKMLDVHGHTKCTLNKWPLGTQFMNLRNLWILWMVNFGMICVTHERKEEGWAPVSRNRSHEPRYQGSATPVPFRALTTKTGLRHMEVVILINPPKRCPCVLPSWLLVSTYK